MESKKLEVRSVECEAQHDGAQQGEARHDGAQQGGVRKVHAMVDIETLGIKPGCVVHEIAVVMFDPVTFAPVDRFHVVVNIHNAAQVYGLAVEADTLEWWEKQGGPVQEGAQPMLRALVDTADFIRRHKPALVWAKGKDFDFPALGECFDRVQWPRPWEYWQLRCSRDFVKLAGYRPEKKPTHGALQDALDQVEAMAEAAARLQRGKFCGQKFQFLECEGGSVECEGQHDGAQGAVRKVLVRVWNVAAVLCLVVLLGWAIGGGIASGFMDVAEFYAERGEK